jgi:hypothetical protein
MTRRDDGDAATARALRQMAKGVVPVEQPEQVDARRARLLPALTDYADDVFARTPRRSARISWKSVIAVAAALSTLALVAVAYEWRASRLAVGTPALRVSDGAVRVTHDGATSETARDVPLNLGAHDTVETGHGHAEVSLESGASVALGEDSKIELDAVTRTAARASERLALVTGHIEVHVPKLPQGSHLVIDTADARVTVHGTAFVVDVHPGQGGARPTTTVAVTEGKVSVLSSGREIFLGPGAHWSSEGGGAGAGAEPPPPPALTEPPAGATPGTPSPRGVATGQGASGASSTTGASVADRRSTLAAETDLLRAAMAARRAGNPTLALELLERLVSSYPRSPLRPEAFRERVRAEDDLAKRPP